MILEIDRDVHCQLAPCGPDMKEPIHSGGPGKDGVGLTDPIAGLTRHVSFMRKPKPHPA
jgi:hypothetical protein